MGIKKREREETKKDRGGKHGVEEEITMKKGMYNSKKKDREKQIKVVTSWRREKKENEIKN